MNACVICTSARAGAGTGRVPLNRANVSVTRAAVHRIQQEYSTEVSAPAPAFPSPPAATTQCKQPKRILKTICQPGGPLDTVLAEKKALKRFNLTEDRTGFPWHTLACDRGLWKSLICPDSFYNRVSRSDIAEKVNNPHTHTTPANNGSI